MSLLKPYLMSHENQHYPCLIQKTNYDFIKKLNSNRKNFIKIMFFLFDAFNRAILFGTLINAIKNLLIGKNSNLRLMTHLCILIISSLRLICKGLTYDFLIYKKLKYRNIIYDFYVMVVLCVLYICIKYMDQECYTSFQSE
ncbi:hypothetical protein EDEG_00904 [Edhazardia aedis USNM 41457]|uniref:Uncharacterized protein n=1 Tax=Edhazardia aedis (strain USNM 41457) TaxID=1003232 RepID=J9DUL1_EDHAE|nr:hypothetical protein EDEG_00904 [Edhazardia aedis USNM 41457]|eukprot:EJW04987.1 hypothetical protein EDEG_00904 [Edhazardia aedis USNM 41457]